MSTDWDPKNQKKAEKSHEKRLHSFPSVKSENINPTSSMNTPLLELIELWVDNFLILEILSNNLIIVH